MLVLAFGVGPGPRIYTKLLKVPLTILRRLMIEIVAYLDDLLIIEKTMEGAIRARDTVLFLLQRLGFTINWEKSVLQPTREVEFLGMMINSARMEIWLPTEKAQNILTLCRDTIQTKRLTLRRLASLIGKLQATLAAIPLAPMQIRALQQDLIKAQQKQMSYEQEISLSKDSLKDLQWWVNNITLYKGSPVRLGNPEMIISTDASSSEGWEHPWKGGYPRGECGQRKRRKNIISTNQS